MSDILEKRYASGKMRDIWSDDTKYSGWREVWVAVAEAQQELGLPITDAQIAELRAHIDDIDYARAAQLERIKKHDVNAHKQVYIEQCPDGGKIIHQGMTSDNVTSPTESIQTTDSLYLVMQETARVVDILSEKAEMYKGMPCAGYTHFQKAQPVTMGHRIARWAQGFSRALNTLEYRYDTLLWGGIRGATGTRQPLMKVFNGDRQKIKLFEKIVARNLGLGGRYTLTGQTPPRTSDYEVISALAEIGIAAKKFGTDVRLLWESKQVGEPFEEGQEASSIMAYKQNCNRSERMCSLARELMEKPSSAAYMAGDQWLERTVDDSAQRRIILPDSFLLADSILQLAMFIGKGLRVYPARVERALKEDLAFAATEDIITAAVNAGTPRATAYDIVYKHSQAVQRNLMENSEAKNDFIERLLQDFGTLGLSNDAISGIIGDGRDLTGDCAEQVEDYINEVVNPIRNKYEEALKLQPEVEV